MKGLFLVFIFLSHLFTTWAQTDTMCYNGIKDSNEDYIDCTKKGICQSCNGTSNISFNNKQYGTGISTITVNDATSTEFTNGSTNKKRNDMGVTVNFESVFYTDGTSSSGFTFAFLLTANPLKEGKYYGVQELSVNSYIFRKGVLKPGQFTFTITYHQSSNAAYLKKIKVAKFEIVGLDLNERRMSGNYKIQGDLFDNTPVNLEGNFNNISY